MLDFVAAVLVFELVAGAAVEVALLSVVSGVTWAAGAVSSGAGVVGALVTGVVVVVGSLGVGWTC